MPVGSVVARNHLDGVVVLASDARGGPTLEFGATGDVKGEDIQFVPEEIVGIPAFRRALARGILSIVPDESDPEVVAALEKQVVAFQKRQQGATEQVAEVIDRPDNRDTVSVFCVGPNTRGSGNCGEPVAVKESKKDDEPPLCSQHKHLAFQFVPEHRIEGDGKRVVWNRVTLTARESGPRS